MKLPHLLITLSGLLAGCSDLHLPVTHPHTVAFMPDVHFQDIYGNIDHSNAKFLATDNDGNPLTIRTMSDQLGSTRLFNENYFAFIAALDDAASKGIKLIVLNGDFSDDGQPYNLVGLAEILKSYKQKYDMQFFLSPGNHDPSRPFGRPAPKKRLLTISGDSLQIYSSGKQLCPAKGRDICSDQAKEGSYQDVISHLGEFGFENNSEYLYWQTPFGKSVSFSDRQYSICSETNPSLCASVPDLSYVVEPVKDLWLLSIDANVFVPKSFDQQSGKYEFIKSSNAGYNQLVKHKPELLKWIKSVSQQAKAQGKKLIAFSHFPMTEFYDGSSHKLKHLFGESSNQLKRKPDVPVSKVLAQLGIKVHVGGHMHFNDTSEIRYQQDWLINIQAPSLAAYIPAYKALTFTDNKAQLQVKTYTVNDVADFNKLFDVYQNEHQFLTQSSGNPIWDEQILQSESYLQFARQHIRELSLGRFLKEWPTELSELLLSSDSGDLFKGISAKGFSVNWSGKQLITDFYKVRNAGELAIEDIDSNRLQSYLKLHQVLKNFPTRSKAQNLLLELLDIFQALQNGQADRDFNINLDTGEITPVMTK
ncbi:metallophosphoesterase [Parashewanella spongiae]|uniref:Metallophosphoesterase n=1 Tax=Parashewanella spongiae TaxID=342950 RepID=A0A3A6TH01_9GAMM|nr:metallophosphoesterase family protein [Parashewanella spongiae]MCL1079116.1 metallophosphoesterase [Parashewanella spongiae]RJY10725.1 metallophosphoesterase [Parashewanella spongiae]